MAHFPQSAADLGYITYPDGTHLNPDGLLTGDASANAKGAYVEFAASTPFACNVLEFNIINGHPSPTATRQLSIDIATGAAASESVIVPDVITDMHTSANNSSHVAGGLIELPLTIAMATRIAARVAVNSTTENTCQLAVTLIAAGDTPGPASYTAYGHDATDSGGTSVDPGATANVKGSYVQMTASTSAIAQLIVLNPTLRANTAITSTRWAVDIATGAGAAEVVVIPDLRFVAGSAGPTPLQPRAYQCETYIAASTRIALRASCGINDATDRLLDMQVLTAVAPAE